MKYCIWEMIKIKYLKFKKKKTGHQVADFSIDLLWKWMSDWVKVLFTRKTLIFFCASIIYGFENQVTF